MQVGQALALARTLGVARLDALLLLAHHLERPRVWLMTHVEERIDAAPAAAYAADLARRAGGEPLAYLIGEREFHGLVLHVTPDVLVPRPETEVLVDWALELLAGRAASVVDLGTGSGAIALAVCHRCPAATITATDASSAALAVAMENALRLGLTVEFAAGDWWQAVADRHFDLAVSNPPYVAGDDPHLAALTHEPRSALTPEGDGLEALRRIVADAPGHLNPGAWLLLEHGYDQAGAVQQLLCERGFDAPVTRQDLAGLARCTGAIWPG